MGYLLFFLKIYNKNTIHILLNKTEGERNCQFETNTKKLNNFKTLHGMCGRSVIK